MQATLPDSSLPNPGRRRLLLGLAIALVAVGGVSAFFWISNRSPERDEALLLARSGAYDQAIPALLKCLDHDPNDAEVLEELAICMRGTQAAPSDVEPYSRRWCEVRPKDAEPFRIRFSLLKRLSRQLEAIEVGESLLALVPLDDQARLDVLLLYSEVGRYDDARRECLHLRNSAAISQEVVLITLGNVEFKRGDLPAAAQVADELLGRTPGNSAASILRGRIHLEAGELVQAVTVLRRIKAPDRRDRITILHSLGLALARSGQEEEAKRTYQELARVTDADLYMRDAAQRKSDAKYQMRAAKALFVIDDFADAAMILETLHTHAPVNRESMTLLAKCYAGQGQTEQARAAHDRAARLPEPQKIPE